MEKLNYYYNDVHMLSTLYHISNKLGTEYGPKSHLPPQDEFVKPDGVVARNAIYGRGKGSIYRRWYDGACSDSQIKFNHCYKMA